MKTLTSLLILTACLLTGCSTSQTLLSQFSSVPLPNKVARKLYGVCPSCQANPQPNCPACRAIQAERRAVAGTPEGRRNPASYQNNNHPNNGYNRYNGYPNNGTYNRANPYTGIAPMSGPAGFYRPSIPNVTPVCYGVYTKDKQVYWDQAYTDNVAWHNYGLALKVSKAYLQDEYYRIRDESNANRNPTLNGTYYNDGYNNTGYSRYSSNQSRYQNNYNNGYSALGY